MPSSEVTPNKEYFASLCTSGKQSAVARRLGVSLNTLRKLLRGEAVSRGTLETIAERCNVNIALLFAQSTDHLLPDDPNYYESLKYGYFLDHDRRAFGLVKWWRESVALTHKRNGKLHVSGIHFLGSVKNQWGNDFSINAVLTNRYHFSVIGTHHLEATDSVITFDASFSQCIDGVLSGIWSGINHFESAPSLFRIFLSQTELTTSEIIQLSQRIRVEAHFQSEEFGFEDRP